MPRSQQSAIERLAARAAGARIEDFSEKSKAQAKLVLLDALGCGFAALDDACAHTVVKTLQAFGETPRCTVIGHPQKMSAPSAVLANGTLIRVLDVQKSAQ